MHPTNSRERATADGSDAEAVRVLVVESSELDCAVLAQREAGVLRVYDVVAERMPRWSALYPYLADASDRRIEFNFATDKLGLAGVERQPLMGNNCHVGDGFPVAAPVFPFTARA